MGRDAGMTMRALDLFCGGGGAARGILAAGFDEIVGIDIKDHRRSYPGLFIQGDALNPPVRLEDFDFVWASPPCQAFSRVRSRHPAPKSPAIDVIEPTQSLLSSHRYTVIENVPDAPIRCDVILTGPMFGLDRIIRRRHFEISFRPPMHAPILDWQCPPERRCTVSQHMSEPTMFYRRKAAGLPGRLPIVEAREVMGIDAPLTCEEVGEAIPPAYAEFIAKAALHEMKAHT